MYLFLKGKYFPNGVSLKAILGDRPSLAWRSILHGKGLLEKDLVQRVGDGSSLWIWSSPWILDDTYRAPLMKNILVDIDSKVDSLILSTRTCDRGKLDDLFYQRDIEMILKIKPIINSFDFWSWKHNKCGDYSVKSGYWLSSQIFNKESLREAGMLPSINILEDQVWNLKTPPKIKSFLWKVLSGAVLASSRQNCSKRNESGL